MSAQQRCINQKWFVLAFYRNQKKITAFPLIKTIIQLKWALNNCIFQQKLQIDAKLYLWASWETEKNSSHNTNSQIKHLSLLMQH